MIRPATRDDVPALADLARQTDEMHAEILPDYFRVPGAGPTRSRDEMLRGLDDRAEVVLAAEEDGRVVGFVHALLFDTPARPTMTPRRRVHLDDLVVDRAHRRRGIGRSLVDAAAGWARDRGAAELVLTVWMGNDAADGFYRRLGWKTLSRVLHKQL